ncbi:MAG: DNA methylase N-4 [Rhizobiales bacterium NRL2]|nr:MAG: DNA methylase N-4 [Rhizobiales bacterium NRL2]
MSENPNMTTRTQRRAGGARRTRQARGGSREKAASTITMRRIEELRPYEGNARTHSRRQIRQIADSIDRFGFTNPVLIADDDTIIAGHGRVLAAKQLGMREVPTVRLSHMNEAERRAYILADNKLALNAGWDQELLAIELQALVDLDFDVEITGFSLAEIDFTLDAASERDVPGPAGPEDEIPPLPKTAISRPGDLWRCGRHRVLCGDARSPADYDLLLDGEEVDLVFTDPPYNVPIDGHVSGLGKVRHREFAFASGEMSEEAFTAFLTETLGAAADRCRDGAIAFVCMDWRHMGELLAAGRTVFDEMKNLCVWNKTNGGMGAFYRSKHELVFVFKVGSGPHVNSFGLGETGRYRTNVWDYAGINSFGASRDADLAMHPTVKPVALVADAIRDCSRRGDIVLDPFGGSGTALIAAEQVGRKARLLEFDPAYCDTIVRRWERITGKQPTLAATGARFEDVEEERLAEIEPGPAEELGSGDNHAETGEDEDPRTKAVRADREAAK